MGRLAFDWSKWAWHLEVCRTDNGRGIYQTKGNRQKDRNISSGNKKLTCFGTTTAFKIWLLLRIFSVDAFQYSTLPIFSPSRHQFYTARLHSSGLRPAIKFILKIKKHNLITQHFRLYVDKILTMYETVRWSAVMFLYLISFSDNCLQFLVCYMYVHMYMHYI